MSGSLAVPNVVVSQPGGTNVAPLIDANYSASRLQSGDGTSDFVALGHNLDRLRAINPKAVSPDPVCHL